MKRIAIHLASALLIGAGAYRVTGADFEYHLTGSAADVRPQHTEGALLLMGGGGFVDDAFRWFIQKAGGGDIVVMKASEGKAPDADSYSAYLHDTVGGCDSVEMITFHNREASSDPKVLQAIKNAEGIFMGGGAQGRYVDYWKGTPVGAALDAHVRAGRPLGGSSAGLAVLGQICYTANETARLTSEIAMKDPFDKSLTFESDFLHLDLMRGVITDTHFTSRDRLGRLITFLARHASDRKMERLAGIGVDEKTALCIEVNGTGRVFTTAPDGRAWFVLPRQVPEVLVAGKPLTYREVKVIGAGPASTVDVLRRVIDKPAAESNISVVAGELSSKP